MTPLAKPRVAHLTSVHSPTDTRIFIKECVSLAEAGYDVVLVVPCDKSITDQGVRVDAVSRPNGRRQRMLRTVWHVFRRALTTRATIYHLHDPELIPVGAALKMMGKRVIVDVHENLPQQIQDKDWIAPPLRPVIGFLARGLDRVVATFADRIVAATPAIARSFPGDKAVVVENYPIVHELFDETEQLPFEKRPWHVVYLGGITAVRGAREMVRAMSLLQGRREARLQLVGDFGPPRLTEEVKSLPGWNAVDWHGFRSRNEVRTILSRARCGLVLYHPLPNHIEARPNKLFEYMSAGLPVISSNFPDWRAIIEEVECGLLVDPQAPEQIARSIDWIMAHPNEAQAMGARARAAVEEKYNWARESKKLLATYTRVLQQ